jgi:hypothetical protein
LERSVVETSGEGDHRGRGEVVPEIAFGPRGSLILGKGKIMLPQRGVRRNHSGGPEEARKAVGNSAESMWTVVAGKNLVRFQLSPSRGVVLLDLERSLLHHCMWPLGCPSLMSGQSFLQI